MKSIMALSLLFGLLCSISPASADVSFDYDSYNTFKKHLTNNRKNVDRSSRVKNSSSTNNNKEYSIHPDPVFHNVIESPADATTDNMIENAKPVQTKEVTTKKTISKTIKTKTNINNVKTATNKTTIKSPLKNANLGDKKHLTR